MASNHTRVGVLKRARNFTSCVGTDTKNLRWERIFENNEIHLFMRFKKHVYQVFLAKKHSVKAGSSFSKKLTKMHS